MTAHEVIERLKWVAPDTEVWICGPADAGRDNAPTWPATEALPQYESRECRDIFVISAGE